MRLKPTPPVFATRIIKKVSKISKRLKYEVIEMRDVDFDTLIILGDGDVDDVVIPIICHHLDGTKIVGITKPERTRISILKDFPIYISSKICKIALIMDREDDTVNNIYEQAEKSLQDLNIKFELAKDEDQMRKYNCRFGNKIFDFILIISGLDEIPADKHRIEDHLIKAAINLGKIEQPNKKIDTKEAWKALDKKSIKDEILSKLKESKSFSYEIFRQHFRGLELLK